MMKTGLDLLPILLHNTQNAFWISLSFSFSPLFINSYFFASVDENCFESRLVWFGLSRLIWTLVQWAFSLRIARSKVSCEKDWQENIRRIRRTGMVSFSMVIDLIFVCSTSRPWSLTHLLSPVFYALIPDNLWFYDLTCPCDRDNKHATQLFRMDVLGVDQVLTMRLSLTSLVQMRERSFGNGVKTLLSLSVFLGVLGVSTFLIMSEKNWRMKGLRSDLNDSGVHGVCEITDEVDGGASLAGYDCISSLGEVEACSPEEYDFSLVWREAWGSCRGEQCFWLLHKPITKWVSSLAHFKDCQFLQEILCSPFFL